MIHIAFKILVFYKTDDALEQYINRFRAMSQSCMQRKAMNEQFYDCGEVHIQCVRGVSERCKGYKADFIAVQEELTWRNDWEDIRDCILYPALAGSPIPIQIFDGISEDKG